MKAAALPVLIAVSVFSSPAPADATAGRDAEVRTQIEALIPAWNSHDMKTFAGHFAPDADFVNVVGIWWKSRPEIEAAHVATHQTMFKASKLSGRVASVKWIRPDVAVAHMPWTLVGAKTPAGDPVPERKGILVFVVAKDAGRWTIRAAQNTDIVEGALAPPVPAPK
jgi:uncharacterized protein (TIGR02246 family)